MEEDQLIPTVQEFSILTGDFNQLWELGTGSVLCGSKSQA